MQTYTYQIIQNKSYSDILNLQNEIRDGILQEGIPGKVLMVEHQPCITFGRAEKGENLKHSFSWLEKQGFELAQINRGGKITYHGPGQLVLYPIVNMKDFSMGVKQFVCSLEKVMIHVCEQYGIKAQRKDGFPGAWLNEQKKLGSVGIHVRKMVSMHGFSLNINPNLSHFDVMLPCGLDGVQMTSLAKEIGNDLLFKTCFDRAKSAFEEVFSCKLTKSK